MPERIAGYLIHFDEERRNSFLREVGDLRLGFSDALSSADWSVRQWEVCGLLFSPGEIAYWALARKGKKVATGKVRVEFTELTPANISIAVIQRLMEHAVQRNIISSRSGSGGAVPNATWQDMKLAVGQVNPESLVALERLELLRNQSRERINRPGAEIVAEQRDAVGIALDAFDQTGRLRKHTLQGWVAPEGDTLTSFIDGLAGIRTIEDQLIARDASIFPGTLETRTTVVGAVFRLADRRLEVFNVNRTEIENALGVDLLYFHEAFNAWTLIQYKVMEQENQHVDRSPIFRPNQHFDEQLENMAAFRTAVPDGWSPSDGSATYRLNGDGFYFKFCYRVQLEVLSESLLPGMYLPREYLMTSLATSTATGPRGGRIVSFESVGRHLSNTMFADLLRDGWIGTRGIASARIAEIVSAALDAGRSVVIARSRPAGAASNPDQTLFELGL